MTRKRLFAFALGSLGSAMLGLLSPTLGSTALDRLIRWLQPRKRLKSRIRPTVAYHSHRDLISLLRNQGMDAVDARQLAQSVYRLQPASFDEAVKLADDTERELRQHASA